MLTKPQRLESLECEELVALAAYELAVTNRRQRTLLTDDLARSRKARLADLLSALPRTRLKEVCRDLGLDDSGRAAACLAGQTPSVGGAKRKAVPILGELLNTAARSFATNANERP